MQYLTFQLNKVEYAVDVKIVETVVEYTGTTSVPTPIAYMRGVMDLRGRIVPVIDLRRKFNLPEAEDASFSSIIVFSVESAEQNLTVGALVDGVSEVVTLVEDRIEAVTGAGIALWERYVKGIVRFENRMIVIIEPGGLFSIEEINMLHAA